MADAVHIAPPPRDPKKKGEVFTATDFYIFVSQVILDFWGVFVPLPQKPRISGFQTPDKRND